MCISDRRERAMNENKLRGTMSLLQRGDMTLEQTISIVNMWIELTAKKFYAEGIIDGLSKNRESTKTLSLIHI